MFILQEKTRRHIELACEVFTNMHALTKEFSWFNVLGTSFNVFKHISNNYFTMYNVEDYFKDGWNNVCDREFILFVKAVLLKFKTDVVKTSESGYSVYIFNINSIEMGCGWREDDNLPLTDLFAKNTLQAEARRAIREELWKSYNTNTLVTSCSSIPSDSSTKFRADNLLLPLKSEFGKELSEYVLKFLNKNIGRSILLYGPPGTGKSTIARYIVNEHNMKSVRFKLDSSDSQINENVIYTAIDILQPEAVLLDDFDRIGYQERLLDLLQYFSNKVKLIIATANDCSNILDACLRPERFDELIEVLYIDENVINELVENVTEDELREIKTWPIAYIREYAKLKSVLGQNTELLSGLTKRVNAAKKEYDQTCK